MLLMRGALYMNSNLIRQHTMIAAIHPLDDTSEVILQT